VVWWPGRRDLILEIFEMLVGIAEFAAEVDALVAPWRRFLALLGLSSLSGLFQMANSATV